MTGKEIIKVLKKHGWRLDRISGSHHVMIKDGEKRPIPVLVHGQKDLSVGLALTIFRQAGIKWRR